MPKLNTPPAGLAAAAAALKLNPLPLLTPPGAPLPKLKACVFGVSLKTPKDGGFVVCFGAEEPSENADSPALLLCSPIENREGELLVDVKPRENPEETDVVVAAP